MANCLKCGKPAVARGLCGTHYANARYHKQLDAFPTLAVAPSFADLVATASHPVGCRICGSMPIVGRGFCRRHYQAARKASRINDFNTKDKGTLQERFLAKIAKDGPNGCWRWLGQKVRGPHRYGLIWRDGKPVRAHRVAFELFRGPLGPDDVVCHACDNPECTNPDHLFIGTRGVNNKDTASKDRFPLGEKHHAAKLSDSDVDLIRHSTLSNAKIAKLLGVTPAYIYDIRNGRRRTKRRQ